MSEKKSFIGSWRFWVLATPFIVANFWFAGQGVLALFTDSQDVDANAFATGTLDLTTDVTTAAVTFANMAPGDATAGAIDVTNAGSLDYRYSVTSTTTEDTLAAQLLLTIRVEASTAACTATSTGTPVVYGPSILGTLATTNVIGDPTQGADAGDRDLAAAANEVLCFQVSLPLATGNAFQGLSSTATFAFAAEQTANNP